MNDPIFIANAGMVLLTPFLSQLFKMLKLTTDDSFADDAAAERAAHVLQYAVTDDAEAPEYELVLNKLLCGIPLGRPLARQFDIGDSEREIVKTMLNSVIKTWGALGHTSIEGLQSTFLQREGRLHNDDRGWHLLVENHAYDMLLDRLPWSFSATKNTWMDEVLYVDWR